MGAAVQVALPAGSDEAVPVFADQEVLEETRRA